MLKQLDLPIRIFMTFREAFKLYRGDNTGYPGLIRSQKEAENDWIEKNIYGEI